MIRTGRLAVVVLLAALAGCGGDDAEPRGAGTPAAEPNSESSSSSPDPSSTPGPAATASVTAPSADAEPVRPAEAQRALQKGLRELLGGGTVDFRYRMSVGTTALTETTGRSDIAGGWRSSTSFSEELAAQIDEGDEVGDYRMEVRAPGSDDVFMQMVGWPEPAAGCWLRMGPGEVPVGFLAMTPGLPAYVGVLGAVHALGFDPDHDGSEIVATVSLRGALLLLHGRAVQAMAVPAEGLRGTRVPALVFLEDGVVTDVSVYGDDIVEGVRVAGGDADATAASAMASINVNVRYTPAPAGADPVTAPEAALVMTAEDLDAKRGC